MRRVKIRESMRGVMECSSTMAVAMKMSSLIGDTLKACSEMMAHVNSKLLVLHDRQVGPALIQSKRKITVIILLILLRMICSEMSMTWLKRPENAAYPL